MTQRKQGKFKRDNLQNSGCKTHQTWLKWKLNTHVLATTPNKHVSRRRREHDGNVVSKSMRNIAYDVTSGWSCRRPENVSILSSLVTESR